MARQLRIEFPGAIYHVTSRMIGDWRTEKTRLFRDDADRERFLGGLSERVEQYNLRLYLFACMANHFHLVFETPEANCSEFMQSLLTAYTVYHNIRHSRHGHLFDGRYKAKLVEGDEYLLALSRYVHLNPVHVGSMKNKPVEERIRFLRRYCWSSYLSYIGLRKALDFVEYGPLLAQMQGREREWPNRYREFVETGLAESDVEFHEAMNLSPRSIGSDEFRERIDEMYQARLDTHARPEDVSFRHVAEFLPAQEVLAVLGEIFAVDVGEFSRRRRSSLLRAVAARFLIRYAGLNQREVAGLLKVGSGSAVCKQLNSLAGKIEGDRRLGRQLKQAEQRLERARAERGRRRGQMKA